MGVFYGALIHRNRRSRLLTMTAAAAMYTALAVLLYQHAWADPGARIAGGGDCFSFTWFVAFWPTALRRGWSLVTTHLLFAPGGANLWNSTSIPLPSLLVAPITLVAGPVVAYNALMTGAVAASATAAFGLLRATGRSVFAGGIAGLVYGFGGYELGQAAGHANLVVAVFPPVVAWCAYRLWVARASPVSIGVVLGLASAAQLLCSMELLASTILMSAVVVLGALVTVPRCRSRDVIESAITCLGVAALVSLPFAVVPVWSYFAGPRHVTGLLQGANTFVVDLAGFVVPPRTVLLSSAASRAASLRHTGFDGEFAGYVGVPLLVVIAYAWARLRRVVALPVACFGVAAVLAMGSSVHLAGRITRIPLPMRLLDGLPIAQNILPARVMVFAWLAAAAIVARLADDLVPRLRLTRVALGAAFASVAVIASLAPSAPVIYLAKLPDGLAAIADELGSHGQPPPSVLLTPLHGSSQVAMHYQAGTGFTFALPTGAVFTPDGYGTPRAEIFGAIRVIEHVDAPPSPSACALAAAALSIPDICRATLLHQLETAGIRDVIVTPGPGSDRLLTLFTNLLGPPRVIAQVNVFAVGNRA
jgi:hypothetical protein